MTGREAGEWVAPGQRGRHLDGGKVSQTDRWWSNRWWSGHWMRRKKCGEWRDSHGGGQCVRHRGHAGGFLAHKWDPPTRTPSRGDGAAASRADYKAYLEARFQAAERANAGASTAVDSSYFTGRPKSLRSASTELREWFRDHGPNLSPSQFAAQARETSPGRYPY